MKFSIIFLPVTGVGNINLAREDIYFFYKTTSPFKHSPFRRGKFKKKSSHQEPAQLWGNSGGGELCDNLFCPELCPDFLRKEFPNLARMHEICVDFWRDTRILVNKSCMKFDFKDFCAVIISHRAQNTWLDGLSFQKYHYSFTRALNG